MGYSGQHSGLACLGVAAAAVAAVMVLGGTGDPPTKGPATEKRFPPLKLPDGFKATLFACDPVIEYPSAIAVGPQRHSLFVAIDYMTGLGTEIIRKDEIRLLRDADGDGYADESIIYAKDFNSIQGMTYHDGTVYVMHAPFLTALRDTDGDGKADERKDLLTGLGLPPEKNPVRLHCANGVVMGHDGWLYLALGDHGCEVKRPEGDTLVLQGGGILRCRADGTGLHVFATGLRNIYDVALDADLNVFVRDNENDGGTYMIRVCHSFFGADHGYPYLYYERPDEALPPLADLGRGSSAGGVCYLETAFPAEYRGNLFFCEWGRSLVNYPLKYAGSGFAPVKENDFASGAADDPYGFKPTDVVVDRDGALFVADWCDGQRPKRGRGRIYRIAPKDVKLSPKQPIDLSVKKAIEQLNSPSHWQRVEAQDELLKDKASWPTLKQALKDNHLGPLGRNHAVWLLARSEKADALPTLMTLLKSDPSWSVRLQAVRAIADLTDPVLTQQRLEAAPGPKQVAHQLAEAAKGQHPAVLLEIVIALGRLQWDAAPTWLHKNLTKPDAPLRHAAMQTMRRARYWPGVLSILGAPSTDPLRKVALAAASDQYHPFVVGELVVLLEKEPDPARRQEYADALTRVYKQRGPWVYWGYRPAPRPPHTLAWTHSKLIAKHLQLALSDPDLAVRHFILERMLREKVPTTVPALAKWLNQDHDTKRIETVLEALNEHPAAALVSALDKMIRDSKHAEANRLIALKMLARGLDKKTLPQLVALSDAIEDGPVLAQLLRLASEWPDIEPKELFVKNLKSPSTVVRIAAIESLAKLKVKDAPISERLADADSDVRQAAVLALGQLNVQTSADAILKLASSADPGLRSACLDSLCLLKDKRVLPLATDSLANPKTQAAAVRCLAELGGAAQAKAVTDLALKDFSVEVLPPVVKMLSKWSEQEPSQQHSMLRLIAQVQGKSGNVLHWRVKGPLPDASLAALVKELTPPVGKELGPKQLLADWLAVFGAGLDGSLTLPTKTGADSGDWLAASDLFVDAAQEIEVLTSAEGKLRIWLAGELVYQRKSAAAFQRDSDRFGLKLAKGWHRLFVAIGPTRSPARFHLHFRHKSASPEQEKWVQLALSKKGDSARGKDLFFNINKSQCLKCHRLGMQGETIGPDLTSVGKRFTRIHLVESILQPSRSIAPSYETLLVQLKDGRILTGTKVEENAKTLVIGDKDGKKHTLAQVDIDLRTPQVQSIMPDNLVNQFSAQEFLDLIAFLESQK